MKKINRRAWSASHWYYFKNEDIKVSIEAYFDGPNLVIDGYDIGKRVEEYWGDSDYEYMLTIPPAGVDFLFKYFRIKNGSREELLQALSKKYNTNSCYSEICKLMEDNAIKCEGFTWA